MIEVNLSLIERDVIKISPKIRLHWDMRRTVGNFGIKKCQNILAVICFDLNGKSIIIKS